MRALPDWTKQVRAVHTVLRELEAMARYELRPERFRTWSIPTLLLLGGESPPVYRAGIERMQAILPGSTIAVLESAMTVTLPLPGFGLLPFVFKGTTTPAEVPHAVLERSGTLKVPVAGAITVAVTLVSGGCGVHLGMFGSVWLRQSATPMVHWPQVVSVSQAGSLSMQRTLFAGATFWFISASGKVPPMVSYYDGAPPSDPFYQAFVNSVHMNQIAAVLTGVSVLALAVAT